LLRSAPARDADDGCRGGRCTATAMAASRLRHRNGRPMSIGPLRSWLPRPGDVSPVRVVRTSGAVTGAKHWPPTSVGVRRRGAKLTMTPAASQRDRVDYGKDIDVSLSSSCVRVPIALLRAPTAKAGVHRPQGTAYK